MIDDDQQDRHLIAKSPPSRPQREADRLAAMNPGPSLRTMVHDRGGKRTAARREVALRRVLRENPNDEQAFADLVSLLDNSPTAGTATVQDITWSLAEELTRHPQAWFPPLELARVSLDDEAVAMRWIAVAVQRDSTGRALTRAAAILRAAGRSDNAFRLAIAHWRPAVHGPAPGRHLVRAALETGRTQELRRHLKGLAPVSRRVVGEVRAEVETRLGTWAPAPGATKP
jgi:hypothetical protein